MKKQIIQVLIVLASVTIGCNIIGMQWLQNAQNFDPLETMREGINYFGKNAEEIQKGCRYLN